MKKNRTQFLGAILCVILAGSLPACTSRYGHYPDHDRYYSDHGSFREAYDTGYRRGYEHGSADRRSGLNFDFDHDELYRRGISRDRTMNERFREGYARGYESGYYGNRRY